MTGAWNRQELPMYVVMYAQDIGDKDIDDELFLTARVYKIGKVYFVTADIIETVFLASSLSN